MKASTFIIGIIMQINYWYDQNILPYFEERASKKLFNTYRREELAILSLLLEAKESGNVWEDEQVLLDMLKDVRVKLVRFKGRKFYTTKILRY